jgi:alkylation response protein AidB-like acyl-CoA dehydrogenase
MPYPGYATTLFVVPRSRSETNDELVFNDVSTADVFHRKGYQSVPISHLIMGESNACKGYLLDESHKGLSYMFQMVDEAKIGVGGNAVSIASANYYNALDYASI